MNIFTCEHCGQLLHFENTRCMRCGSPLGFLPDRLTLSALAAEADGSFTALAAPGSRWRACANAPDGGCNWLVPEGDAFCPACKLNRTGPDLGQPADIEKWQRLEAAKPRLVYALLRLGLPLESRHDSEHRGLAFEFVADPAEGAPVLTGHADGLVTINLAEADSAERERRRVELGEPYRTLLGHLRHEVGHYYWDLLVRDGGRRDATRAMFRDETVDYAEALKRHHEQGPPPDWPENFVSAHAAAHPWEDFAETWTYYLHMVDTLDTAASFGLAVDPAVTDDATPDMHVAFDPYRAPGAARLVDAWLPLTIAVNSLNRSMGQPDLYPVVLGPRVIEKLGFIHDLVHSGSGPARVTGADAAH
jgi:hypothetical protein